MLLNKLKEEKIDIGIAFLISCISYGCYFLVCISLNNHQFYQLMNIAFDFDQRIFFDWLGRHHSQWIYANKTIIILIKHPFIYAYRLFTTPLIYFGMSVELAVINVSLFFQQMSLVITYFTLQLIGFCRLTRVLALISLAITSCYLSTGTVLDSYTLALFWITAIFYIAALAQYKNLIVSPVWRVIVGIGAFGTTSYLIVLYALMEIFIIIKRENLQEKWFKVFLIKDLYKQACYFIFLAIVVSCIVYFDNLVQIMSDPVYYIKQLFWAVNRHSEKQGIIRIIETFLTYSIVAPNFSLVTLPKNGDIMYDFREFKFSWLGYLFMVIITILVGISLKAIKKINHFVIFCLLWLLCNIVFHAFYQDRGSLFLYTPHSITPVFLLLCIALLNKLNTVKYILIAIAITLLAINNFYQFSFLLNKFS